MTQFTTFHNGAAFKAECAWHGGSFFVTNKTDGRWLYVKGDDARRLQDAITDGWNKFGFSADADAVWQWIWTNCGFHRMSNMRAA